MTREEAEHVAESIFGPRAECIRASSADRNQRFVIAMGSFKISRTERPLPLILGSGASWELAIDHAQTTPNGKMAIEEIQKVKDLVNKAMSSPTPGEFTEFVRESALAEAKEKGATTEQLEKINQKFDEAKKKLMEKKNDDDSGTAEAAEAGREGQSSGDDHR